MDEVEPDRNNTEIVNRFDASTNDLLFDDDDFDDEVLQVIMFDMCGTSKT